ncbi:hypothetical protein [Pseudoxanthomonas mexicana]|uniref:hypothetical protein n=1 Tax=Pseudoxanthomonas mexicana TaxID=128785 RepID=UPI00398B3EFB
MRYFSVFFLLFVALPASSQTMRAQGPRGSNKPPPTAPRQPYNSMARDTTPLNCERYRTHPHPGMKPLCERWESRMIDDEARRQGRPGASTEVVNLPPLGTPGAETVCIGGQAMRKISGGWQQVHSPRGGWQRCRGG